ncbi:MAG: hypothetical protein H7319_15920 [Spirosoma sp.]|nr:hypothetical protein [Spirosoma sp.]
MLVRRKDFLRMMDCFGRNRAYEEYTIIHASYNLGEKRLLTVREIANYYGYEEWEIYEKLGQKQPGT